MVAADDLVGPPAIASRQVHDRYLTDTLLGLGFGVRVKVGLGLGLRWG